MRDGILATGVSPTKVSVIPNCADLELFRPGRADPDLRARFGIGEHFVAVHAGAMGVVNDVGIVIEAASLLEESGIENIRWLLVGEGSQAAMLRQRSRSRGLRSVVFAGSVSRNDVAEIVRASDVCLMLEKDAPILAHASPNKFFDALAAGRPVVVNTGGWMRELLEQHGAGLASEPGSATALAAHVRWLAEHPLHVTDMGRNARRLAEDCFDRRQLAREFEAVLQRASGAEIAPPGVERPTSQARMGTPASIPERSGSAAELTCVRESVAAP
jgi:glycosyltransferase involved in cell wall biosynthesis